MAYAGKAPNGGVRFYKHRHKVCYVITTLFHTAGAKHRSLCCVKVKTTAHLSGEPYYVDALWFKVMRTPISPELV